MPKHSYGLMHDISDSTPQTPRWTFAVLAFAGVIAGLLHIVTKAALRSGTLFVTSYWASFYEMSYPDGFRRRALIGSILRHFEPNGANIPLINGFALLIAFCVLFLLARFAIKQIKDGRIATMALFAAFFFSALTSLYFEVLGDLMQISLLVFLVGCWAVNKINGNIAIRVLSAALFVILGFLIHEGSIFFTVPCLPFFFEKKPSIKSFAGAIVFLGILLAWSTAWSKLQPNLTYHLNLLHGQKLVDNDDILGTPSFKVLMHQMYAVHFAGLRGKLNLLIKILKVFSLISCGWFAASQIFPLRVFTRQIYLYLVMMIASIPFWILAADWGRFTSYCFLLAITLPLWSRSGGEEISDAPSAIQKLGQGIASLGSVPLVQATAIIGLFGSPFATSRVYGMNLQNLMIVLVLAFFAAIQALTTRRERLPA